MICWIPVVVAIVAVVFLRWVRGGAGGSLGRAIRNSDHWAWEMAVRDKKRELAELMGAEPKGGLE